MLGLSVDKRDRLADESLETVRGIPFIAERTFLSHYGDSFEISLSEDFFRVTTISSRPEPTPD